ncbi:hypothetical protein M1D80_04670 (plasmid) [Phyllobacteriaceae bacterium JZ32]
MNHSHDTPLARSLFQRTVDSFNQLLPAIALYLGQVPRLMIARPTNEKHRYLIDTGTDGRRVDLDAIELVENVRLVAR